MRTESCSWISRFATQEAVNEIHRVLKENAVLGMIWNVEDCKTMLSNLKAGYHN